MPVDARELIRRMSQANLTRGAPRIVGQLGKLGIVVAQSTGHKHMVRRHQPPAHTWRASFNNHASDLVSIDFFVVPTTRFRVLLVRVVLTRQRQRLLHFHVTENPTAEWTAQQIVNAFRWDEAPSYLLKDRDGVYGQAFHRRVQNMGSEEVIATAQSPWRNAYAQRLIGSIRRECFAHAAVLNERHFGCVLRSYPSCCLDWRTPLWLKLDCPQPRPTLRQLEFATDCGAAGGQVVLAYWMELSHQELLGFFRDLTAACPGLPVVH